MEKGRFLTTRSFRTVLTLGVFRLLETVCAVFLGVSAANNTFTDFLRQGFCFSINLGKISLRVFTVELFINGQNANSLQKSGKRLNFSLYSVGL